MYNEWTSLSPIIAANSNGSPQTVLTKFVGNAGRDVSAAVAKQLASNLGITQTPEPSILLTEDDVNWCMCVICHGLSLPLSEHETIKDCVNVYCEWLSALYPTPKVSVPKPICDEPNVYARKIIQNFHNLFVPRHGEGIDVINRQAVLCHRVLRTLQYMAQTSQKLTNETWESLLLFLLAINEVLLAPPIIKDDVGDQLCERVLSVLFEVWLVACVRCFPSPSLWKTLQESCALLRHRIALVEQWNRVNLALTARLLAFMYGPTFPALKILEEDTHLIPEGMTDDCVAQTWYRFMRTFGSPIVLCSPQIISKTPQFMQWAVSRTDGSETFHHPCLVQLPQIFLKAIKGIASLVDAFLGIYSGQHICEEQVESGGIAVGASSRCTDSKISARSDNFSNGSNCNVANNNLSSGTGHSSVLGTNAAGDPTPPMTHRRLAKSFSVSNSTSTKGISKGSLIGLTSSRSSVQQPLTPNSGPPSSSSFLFPSFIHLDSRSPLAILRPKCNSILHLFGEWLFDAAHIGGEAWALNIKKQANEAIRRPSSMVMDNRKGSLSQPPSLNDNSDLPAYLRIENFESGRAEAIGALCRIFCAKKTNEEINPVYLARFYVALQQGLKISDSRECEETLASILYNCSDLFRLDMDGIEVILPAFIAALELVLPDKELKMKSNILFNKNELRRASIQILLSILSIPLHFQTLAIRDMKNPTERSVTFIQLKPRLINILMNAIQVETDPQNTHMLLGGLLLCVQDAAFFEENVDTAMDIRYSSPTASDTNLLSSAYSDKSGCSIASGSSSIGGNSTATFSGNEINSLTVSDDDIDFSASYDTAHALFVRATYLVCHRLISSWKTDLNVSLAALEQLTGLARANIKDSDALECKRAVKWICDYICYQCSRPPPAHSKDLHSTIVAAFQCTSAWLMQNPYLLNDKECLTIVFEVIELGISGSKSVGKPSEPIRFKDDKELKPVSIRVREAAETLLFLVLEQIGNFPSECGPHTLSSLLDEITLHKHCNSNPSANSNISVTPEQAIKKFRYFVTENSTIFALLEEPLGNDQDPQPTITALMRGPFGRNAWTMQLRHLPRSKSGTKYHAPYPGRPVPMNDLPMRHEVEQKFYPDGVERVMNCIVDYSIPTIEQVIQKKGNVVGSQLSHLLENQIVLEKLAWAETDSSEEGLGHTQESEPPAVCNEFQAARLFLSNFGFLSMAEDEGSENMDAMSPIPMLTVLDATKPGFLNDLQSLDNLSPRTNDTTYGFYVKVGQNSAEEIIGNMSDENVGTLDKHFWNVLLSLGWPVDVGEHPGWTGNIRSSRKLHSENNPTQNSAASVDALRFNGEKQILYWADVCSEIAFIVPTNFNKVEHASDDGRLFTDSEMSHTARQSVNTCQSEIQSAANTTQKRQSLALDLDKKKSQAINSLSSGGYTDPVAPTRRKTGVKSSNMCNSNAKLMLVWLESFEDNISFPADELLAYSRTVDEFQGGQIPRGSDCYIIFLHALNSGLLRVKLQSPQGRMNFATPLVDGMVVSKRVVGSLIRQTILNMAKRRRLDNDLYQPPHVRRRLKVLDMVHKYKIEMTDSELLAHLFRN